MKRTVRSPAQLRCAAGRADEGLEQRAERRRIGQGEVGGGGDLAAARPHRPRRCAPRRAGAGVAQLGGGAKRVEIRDVVAATRRAVARRTAQQRAHPIALVTSSAGRSSSTARPAPARRPRATARSASARARASARSDRRRVASAARRSGPCARRPNPASPFGLGLRLRQQAATRSASAANAGGTIGSCAPGSSSSAPCRPEDVEARQAEQLRGLERRTPGDAGQERDLRGEHTRAPGGPWAPGLAAAADRRRSATACRRKSSSTASSDSGRRTSGSTASGSGGARRGPRGFGSGHVVRSMPGDVVRSTRTRPVGSANEPCW